MLSNCGAGEGSWESLGLQGDQITVNPKGNELWIFFGRTDAEADAPILWPPDAKGQLIGKAFDAGRDSRQKEKGAAEDEMVSIINSMNMNLSKLQETVEERGAWCVHGVTKSWTQRSDSTTITTFNHSWLERPSWIICLWLKNAFIHLLSFPS